MKWKLGKIETITLPDTEVKCTNSAQEKETQKTHTQKQKTHQPTNGPTNKNIYSPSCISKVKS